MSNKTTIENFNESQIKELALKGDIILVSKSGLNLLKKLIQQTKREIKEKEKNLERQLNRILIFQKTENFKE